MSGKVIFLNGVTSCGKTTVAKCVQEMCDVPVYVFSNDIFHGMVSYRAYEKREHAFSHLVADTITAQYYAARGCADAGFHVLIDGMLLDLPEYTELFGKRNMELVNEIFDGCDLTMVSMTCPPAELRRRNRVRGDRGVNQSDEQLSVMTKEIKSDLDVDVMTVMPDETAEQILRHCGLPPAGDVSPMEYISTVRRRFLADVLKPYNVKIEYVAVADAEGEPMRSAVTVDSAEQAMVELTARGYEAVSETKAVRRYRDGPIRETVRLNEGTAEPREPMDYLGRRVSVKIDRPMGCVHPKCPDMIYGVNYGYVEDGIVMPDGEKVDAYLLGVDVPAEKAEGRVTAVLHRRDDDEDKLIVVPEGVVPKREDIRRATHFCEQYFDGAIYLDKTGK